MTTDLPDSLAETWQPLGTRTGETSVLVASITAETTLYGPTEPEIRADRGESAIPPRSLFAVDLDVSPSLSSIGISPDSVLSKAAPEAKSQFVETIEGEGLAVENTRETHEFEAQNGTAGIWYVLEASYPIDSGDGTPRIATEAHVAVWPTETSYGVAGGTVPLETPDAAGGSNEDGLAVDPERDRETIATLVRTVDLGT
ncbi:hypothetical protein [Halopiger djelfimassiliensis]|uniref:hypothetical protein n=1 Tax=Halopiger djelfimassiliensis TaxID=1293047 RepID=UPI00067782FD|nr:hypothetical protein [Halopiger djelfimassiliensis]